MNPVRGLLAVLVGMGLFRLVVAALETVLVSVAGAAVRARAGTIRRDADTTTSS